MNSLINNSINTFSLSLKEKEIFHILSFLLKDHHDLVFFILNINKKKEFLVNKNYHIEKDFYNWLNFDVIFRNELEICTKWNIDLYCESRSLNNIEYKNDTYNDLLYRVGLDDDYRRTKSLTECFNSDWWRTHPKRSFYWIVIHKQIINDNKIKLLINY